MMSELWKGTKIEPKLTPFSGKKLQGRTSNNSKEARVDIGLEVTAFFDLRVFDLITSHYCNKCHVMNEQGKMSLQ